LKRKRRRKKSSEVKLIKGLEKTFLATMILRNYHSSLHFVLKVFDSTRLQD